MAMALASLALLTMLGVFTSGLRLLTTGQELAVSTGQAREMMEQIKAVPFTSVVEGTFDGRVPTPLQGSFPPAPYPHRECDGSRYFFKITVVSTNSHLKLVTTEVLWKEKRTVLQTYLFGQ